MTSTRPGRRRRFTVRFTAILIGLVLAGSGAMSASAVSYVRIFGAGSSWAGNALAQWVADVKAQGVTVDYDPSGSSIGRKQFAQNLQIFGVSEIPYKGDTADQQDTTFPTTGYTMMPMVAGGTSFMYNLPIGGQRFTNLKLSPAALAGIFTGQITRWNDPAIAADNVGVALPDQRITVVVRSEGSGATAQFTLWMIRQFPQAYKALCAVTHCTPNSATSYFPYQGMSNFVAQSGSNGVTTYTRNTPYTINYDEYSYAVQIGWPVAKIKNAAGYYVVPTDTAVAVALTQAKINTDTGSPNYLSQDLSNVYGYLDPRSYPLSAYSYFIVPTQPRSGFSTAQGATLGFFTNYSLCEGQRTMGALGYSPLPMNLVLAAQNEVLKIPGVDQPTQSAIAAVKAGALSGTGADPCNNPTFKPGDDPSHNLLVDQAKFPDGCDAACQAPWKLASAATNSSGPHFDVSTAGNNGASGANGGAGGAGNDASDSGGKKVCDPDTGICTTIDAVNTSSVGNAKAVPLTVATEQGWAGPQTLMALVAILIAAVILAPPIITRAVKGRRR